MKKAMVLSLIFLTIFLAKSQADTLYLKNGRSIEGLIKSVEAQGAEAKNVEAAIMLEEAEDINFGDGLLGMSFLKRFNFRIDNQEKKLILEKLQ